MRTDDWFIGVEGKHVRMADYFLALGVLHERLEDVTAILGEHVICNNPQECYGSVCSYLHTIPVSQIHRDSPVSPSS